MHPPEHGRIQTGLQLVQAPQVRRPGYLSSHNGNRVLDERGVDYVVSVHQGEMLADADRELTSPFLCPFHQTHQSADLVTGRHPQGASVADAVHGLFEPRQVHRLQQVVHRVDLEGLDRALVVGRHEDHLGTGGLGGQLPRRLEPGEPGHLQVQEDHVRMEPGHRFEGLDAVVGLAGHLDAFHLAKEVAQLVAGELLVVDDEGGEGR